MDAKKLNKAVLKILTDLANRATALNQLGIDFAVAIEEIADCSCLLEHNFSKEAVAKVAGSTTSKELCELLESL